MASISASPCPSLFISPIAAIFQATSSISDSIANLILEICAIPALKPHSPNDINT